MIPLENRVALAKAVATRASALGFGPCEYEVRDAYSRESCRGSQLDQLLSQYRPGDNVTIETLVNIGRSKVRIT
jgi:hypothetical protein